MDNKEVINFSDFFRNPENEEIIDKNIAAIQFEIPKVVNESIQEVEEIEEEPVIESIDNFYSVFKDKSEDFTCEISVEGANLNNTEARLILESDEWSLVFNGEIDRRGKCVIPMKKLSILEEGLTGKIKLEVIAEGSIFTPWEDEFKVKMSKKVSVKLNETKTTPKKPTNTAVKVNIKK